MIGNVRRYSLIDVYLCAKNFNLMEAWPPGTIGYHRHRHRKLCAKNFNLMEAWPPGTIRNHRHRHSCRDRLRPRLRTETRDRDFGPRLETKTRDLGLETRDKILHFWWFPGLSQNLT